MMAPINNMKPTTTAANGSNKTTTTAADRSLRPNFERRARAHRSSTPSTPSTAGTTPIAVTPDSEWLRAPDFSKVSFDCWMDYDLQFSTYNTAFESATAYDEAGYLHDSAAADLELWYGSTRRSLYRTHAYEQALRPSRGGMGRPPRMDLDDTKDSHVYPRGHGVRVNNGSRGPSCSSPCRGALQRREKRMMLKLEKERTIRRIERELAIGEEEFKEQAGFLQSARALSRLCFGEGFLEEIEDWKGGDSGDDEAVGFDGYEPSDDEVDWE